ncbi:MAG: hypothetical protein SPJ13_02490 [Bacteroidales bacterium]|nr:hypothetical protein [Bacteroidales bacterium]
MKKNYISFVAALMLAAGVNAVAQNDFKGIVTYTVTSTGKMTMEIPEQIQNPELKVLGNKVFMDEKAASLFASSAGFGVKCAIIEGLKYTLCYDFSQVLAAINQMGEELATYRGDGKIVITSESKQSAIDSMTIVDTEPGHIYLEYPEGETKEIAGRTAHLARIHAYGEDGEETITNIWFDPSIGPSASLLFYGIKGLPLEMTLPLGEGRAVTLTANEVKNGKVKDVDFLLPSGYNRMTEKEFAGFMQEFSETLQYLQGE